jgi:hypothetical protein
MRQPASLPYRNTTKTLHPTYHTLHPKRIEWAEGERAIGLHVRLGDSCKTNIRRNKCVALERHLAEVGLGVRG